MRNYYSGTVGAFLLTLFLFAVQSSAAVLAPLGFHPPNAGRHESPRLDKDGVKLSFGEKLAFKLIQKKWEKRARKNKSRLAGIVNGREGNTNEARHNSTSMMLGVFSLASILVGLIATDLFALFLIVGLLLAIVGLSMGVKGLKQNYPKPGMAVVGVVASGITLGMGLLIGVLAIAIDEIF